MSLRFFWFTNEKGLFVSKILLVTLFFLFFLINLAKLGRKHGQGAFQKGASWLEAVIKDLFYQSLHCLFFPLALFPWGSKKHDKTPIILVHGYMHTRVIWLYHLFHLKKQGFGPIFTLNLGKPFSSIQSFRNKLSTRIKDLSKELGKEEFYLIGHSMGGLVCIASALEKTGNISIKKVITIGSPIHGTKAAKLAIGECAREMEKDSSFTQSLAEKMQQCATTEFFHIGSKTDQLVFPASSSFLRKDRDHVCLVEGVGHVGMMASKKVHQKLSEYLSSKTLLSQTLD